RARLEVKPARLHEAAGVWYDEFANLPAPVPVRPADGSPLRLDTAAGVQWADGLILEGAEALAEYEHPHYGRFPAVTTKAHGQGRVTCVGTVPDAALGAALFAWLAPAGAWRPDHPSVTATSGVTAAGETIRFVHNWSWNETEVPLPAAAVDLLGEVEYAAGASLPLGPWDVKVLREAR
ncbi:MAG: beta-galactosidase, partial [Glycomyces artemisiae]|nr:beta-galactosidase [Glycomyces artemisiae]